MRRGRSFRTHGKTYCARNSLHPLLLVFAHAGCVFPGSFNPVRIKILRIIRVQNPQITRQCLIGHVFLLGNEAKPHLRLATRGWTAVPVRQQEFGGVARKYPAVPLDERDLAKLTRWTCSGR